MKPNITAFLFLFTLSNLTLQGQEATKWRGPNQGVYNQPGLLTKWPASGPEILWTFEQLGIGYSTPSFAHENIYVSGMEGSTGYVYCLSSDGKIIWKSTYGSEFDTSYPGSRATPVIDGDKLYMLSGNGDMACLDAQNGRIIWKKNIVAEFGGRVLQWGFNETMVIHGNKLICTPGGTTHNVIALDKNTGKLIWSSKGKSEESAYCTPILAKVGSRDLLITHSANNILGIDANSGEMLWNYPHTNRWSVHPNTPLVQGNQLFCFSGYGKGGSLLQLNADGSNVTKIWSANDMDSRMGGAVVMNDKIYGSGDNNREWQCIDWETGKVEYSTKEIGNGAIIASNGLLYWYSQRGELALVKPGASSFEIISETRITKGSEQHWAHPAIYSGVLYIRHGNTLIAYNISQ
jgi:outer membrane protein assembly factor BamB